MFDTVIQGIFSSTADITLGGFLIGVGSALVLGIAMAFMYMYKNKYTKSFVITLATLPAIVSIVIMMVSGSIGAGVAVAGTFSLVRFRSVPGTAKEIGSIFLAMAVGLACGMGYPAVRSYLCGDNGSCKHSAYRCPLRRIKEKRA